MQREFILYSDILKRYNFVACFFFISAEYIRESWRFWIWENCDTIFFYNPRGWFCENRRNSSEHSLARAEIIIYFLFTDACIRNSLELSASVTTRLHGIFIQEQNKLPLVLRLARLLLSFSSLLILYSHSNVYTWIRVAKSASIRVILYHSFFLPLSLFLTTRETVKSFPSTASHKVMPTPSLKRSERRTEGDKKVFDYPPTTLTRDLF